MSSAKWEDMKQMKRLTKLNKKQIIMRSLPVVILAAIAFISLPSLLPANYDKMKRSVALIECREYYEIRKNGLTIAVCNDIDNDTTLNFVKEEVDSDTERKAMVCGCWINRLSFMPSCRGRIMTVFPFNDNDHMLDIANANISAVIDKTLRRAKEAASKDKKKQAELEYYLNTHSVKDEGYNTMADYAESNKKKREKLEKGIKILEKLKGEKGIRINRNRYYTLLYPTENKGTGKIACTMLANETKKLPRGTIMLKTKDAFMPEDAYSVYTFDVFCLIPEKGDSITVAGIFGLNNGCSEKASTQSPNVFKGRTTSLNTHDIPELLAPEGAPIFNRNGFFIGINNKGEIKR